MHTPLVAQKFAGVTSPSLTQALCASSVRALQSLSLPSHTSAVGPVDPVQVRMPLAQVMVPALHSPMQLATTPPGQLVAQAAPTSVGLLSTVPLQSSSTPLQVSAVGP